MLRRLGLTGINAQLAACVSLVIVAVETIIIIPSIVVHFNHTLEDEVARQLMLGHVAGHTRPTGDAAAGDVVPYITIHRHPPPVVKPDMLLIIETLRAMVGSLAGWDEEWYVRYFAVSDVMGGVAYHLLADTETIHDPHATPPIAHEDSAGDNVGDDMAVAISVPPDFMRQTLVSHVIERGLFVLVILVLAGIAFLVLVHCQVIRPLRQLLDKVFRLNAPPSPLSQPHTTQSALAYLDQHSAYEAAQREKLATVGAAVAKINHDMKNVLSAATLVSDSLTASKDPAVMKAAPRVNCALNRAVDLCQQMLTYLNTPEQLTLADTDMAMLVDEVRRGLGIPIAYQGPKALCLDGGQFFRLLLNLVDNAKKAAAKTCAIRVVCDSDRVVMEVTDDGPGMDAATQARLFKPFQTRAGSSGLGLSIARDIARMHGGELTLASTSSQGSSFRVVLPRYAITSAASGL